MAKLYQDNESSTQTNLTLVYSPCAGGALVAGDAGKLYNSAVDIPEGLISITLPPHIFQNLTNSMDTVSVLFNTYESSALFPVSNETQYTLANISDPELVGQFQVASSLVTGTLIGYNVRNLPSDTKVTVVLRLQSNVSRSC